MGTDNLFNKKRDARKQREVNIINQRPNRWLIVTEGTRTEPIYFRQIIDIINCHLPNEYKLNCDIYGEGKNTTSLVKSTDDLQYLIDKEVKKRIIPYDKIFVVFDRDSFDANEFNKAIKQCEINGYIPLWSNEAIEYWFLLYFNYYDCVMSRSDYKVKIEAELKKHSLNLEYKKNNEKCISAIINNGSLVSARRNAKRIYERFNVDNISPDKANSCTAIFKFFEEVDERNKTLSLKGCKDIFK